MKQGPRATEGARAAAQLCGDTATGGSEWPPPGLRLSLLQHLTPRCPAVPPSPSLLAPRIKFCPPK